MILYQGDVYDNHKQKEKLESLRKDCYETLQKDQGITADDVILACDQLAQKVKLGSYDAIILPLLEAFDIPYDYFLSQVPLFEKEALYQKVEIELGSTKDPNRITKPLGILFHIAAGNIDALPAYSVIEGLLVGNINILKLPSGDQGLSVQLLSELIKLEPKLKPYIYVFDVPSTEVETLKIFADIADAIVVWGGDIAVKAARQMASTNTKIIEWGHKLSFAYATNDVSDQDLEGIAHHMCMTNQVLCSSAQGIFLDTNSREVLDAFAQRFFDIFIKVNQTHTPIPFGMKSKNALELYNEKLEQHITHKRIWQKDGISVITSNESNLELSMLFRSIWIKMLPKDAIINQIKPHKNHIQTVGILAPKVHHESLIKTFINAGATKISNGFIMSHMTIGESHDGMYPLRQYSKIVEVQLND